MLPPFQALVDAHGPDVMRFLVASVGPHEADDCWQETFLSALRAYPRMQQNHAMRAWLFTIARNKAVDTHRSRARRPVPVGEVPEAASNGAGGGDPALWNAVRQLPPKQREAVLLRHVGDLPYEQVGEAMGTSAEAARRNVHEGVKRLREVWS